MISGLSHARGNKRALLALVLPVGSDNADNPAQAHARTRPYHSSGKINT